MSLLNGFLHRIPQLLQGDDGQVRSEQLQSDVFEHLSELPVLHNLLDGLLDALRLWASQAFKLGTNFASPFLLSILGGLTSVAELPLQWLGLLVINQVLPVVVCAPERVFVDELIVLLRVAVQTLVQNAHLLLDGFVGPLAIQVEVFHGHKATHASIQLLVAHLLKSVGPEVRMME